MEKMITESILCVARIGDYRFEWYWSYKEDYNSLYLKAEIGDKKMEMHYYKFEQGEDQHIHDLILQYCKEVGIPITNYV